MQHITTLVIALFFLTLSLLVSRLRPQGYFIAVFEVM